MIQFTAHTTQTHVTVSGYGPTQYNFTTSVDRYRFQEFASYNKPITENKYFFFVTVRIQFWINYFFQLQIGIGSKKLQTIGIQPV